MTDYFPLPSAKPNGIMLSIHEHDWYEVGAELTASGKWYSVWACTLCPDIGSGGYVGPIPPGMCERCGWVQKKWPRKRCEDCKAAL